MTTLEYCVKYGFVAPLRKIAVISLAFFNAYVSAFKQVFVCYEKSYVKALR